MSEGALGAAQEDLQGAGGKIIVLAIQTFKRPFSYQYNFCRVAIRNGFDLAQQYLCMRYSDSLEWYNCSRVLVGKCLRNYMYSDKICMFFSRSCGSISVQFLIVSILDN